MENLDASAFNKPICEALLNQKYFNGIGNYLRAEVLYRYLQLFVWFVALCPKSTAMVMAGRSVHLTTLISWATLNKQLTSTLCTYFGL